MLKGLFTRMAKSPFIGSRPRIVVDFGHDDPSRGDMHGFAGLARRIAHKLGGDAVFVDAESLALAHPGGGSHLERLMVSFEKSGYPDILFGWSRENGNAPLARLREKGTGLVVSSVNEKLSTHIPRPCDSPHMVAHHLSAETLRFEGEKFAQEYDELPRPYIAVLVADCIEPEADSQRLAEICRNYQEATVFVCTSCRSWSDFYEMFLENLKTRAAEFGMGERLHLVGYDFQSHQERYGPNAHYNMYPGLLDQADHVILSGYSGSIASEVLATGKVPFATKHEWYGQMVEDGLVASFAACSPDKPLETARVTPIDITADLADYLIGCHRRNRAAASRFRLPGAARKAAASPDFVL